MSEINLNKFFNNIIIQPNNRIKSETSLQGQALSQKPSDNVPKQIIEQPSVKFPQINTENIQMNRGDKAVYARDLLMMPRNLNEFVYMSQRGMTLRQFNQLFNITSKFSLNQMQTQILAQLQSVSQLQNSSAISTQLKNLEILSNGMIDLNNLSILINKNGKDAITKLIMTMTESAKLGITDLNQFKEMARLINASVAVATENQPQKTLKLLIMLYLPWLPLTEGIDFELELGSATENDEKAEDTILKISITTIHYGLIKVTLFLETTNSVQIAIEADQNFPKKDLLSRIDTDKKNYSIDTVTTFILNKKSNSQSKYTQTNVNMSQVNKINPYLLLIGHSLIKNIIDIDNNT